MTAVEVDETELSTVLSAYWQRSQRQFRSWQARLAHITTANWKANDEA